ncbi:hypothetical protein HRbin28_01238 [bacterium HR28]|nr:hypothetical protein HRbin28_01238 [bacterium HR28]
MSTVSREAMGTAARLATVPLANAAATVALAAYLICAVLSALAPGVLVWFFQPWLHGLSLEPLRPAGTWFRPAEFVIGLITFPAAVWLTTAAIAALYNTWAHR